MNRKLKLVPDEPTEIVRVCGIVCIPNEAHMQRCARIIRDREPPLWSWSGFRITRRPKLRKVR